MGRLPRADRLLRPSRDTATARTRGSPIAAYGLSAAQRSLSTPARALRRHVHAIDGTITYDDGRQQRLTTTSLLAPLEAALKATASAVVALAVALILYRATTP